MPPELATAEQTARAVRGLDAGALSDTALVEALGEVSDLVSRLEGARASLVAEIERRGLWARGGAVSPEQWLATTLGVSRRTAHDHTVLATALDTAPELAEALTAGRLSPDTARALAPVASTEAFATHGAALIDRVAGLRPEQAIRQRDRWLAEVDPMAAESAEQSVEARRTAKFADPVQGLASLHVELPPASMRTVRATLDHLVASQRDDGSGRTGTQRLADALVELCDAYAKGTVTGGRERPSMLAIAPYDMLVERAPGHAVLATGESLSAAHVRRLACDANLHRVITGPDSAILDFGRSRRLATPDQFRALVARDGGCRWPGCDRPPGWCEVDHLDEWTAHRGPTDLDRLVLFCSRHHHLRHEPGVRVHGGHHDLTIELADGTMLNAPPKPLVSTARPDCVAARSESPIDVAERLDGVDAPVENTRDASLAAIARDLARQLTLAMP